MAARMDRDEVFLELTRSICPRCKRVIDAEVNARDNRVVLRKRCPEHGTFEALVSSDAEAYVAQQRLKPGLPGLLRRLRTAPARPLLAHARTGRSDARRVRGGRGRARGAAALRRRADDTP